MKKKKAIRSKQPDARMVRFNEDIRKLWLMMGIIDAKIREVTKTERKEDLKLLISTAEIFVQQIKGVRL